MCRSRRSRFLSFFAAALISSHFFASGASAAMNRSVPARADSSTPTKTYYASGKLKSEWIFTESTQTGVYKLYFEKGPLQAIRYYKNGVPDGVSKEFYEGGGVKTEWRFRGGKLHGETKEFWPSGQMRSITNF